MLHQQDRDAALAQPGQHRIERADLAGTQAGRRFVEQEQARLAAERAGQVEQLLLPERQMPGLHVDVRGEPDPLQP